MIDNVPRQKISDVRYDIIGIVFLCLGIFLFISNIYPDATGIIGGTIVSALLHSIIGKGVFILPIYISLVGIFMLFGYVYIHFGLRLIGVIVGFFSIISLLELFKSGIISRFTWPPSFNGGGIIGYLISYLLQLIVGIKGAYIVIIASVLCSLLLIFNIKVKDILIVSLILSKKILLIIKKIIIILFKKQAPVIAKEKPQKKFEKHFAVEAFVKGEPSIEETEKIIDKEKQKEDIRKKLFPEVNPVEKDKKESLKKEEKKQESPPPILSKSLDTIDDSISYQIPSINLLNDYKTASFKKQNIQEEIIKTTQKLEDTLASFKIEAKVVSISQGPAVTRYEVQPGAGIKVSKIVNLSDDLALSLAATGIRIEAPIPGKSVVGIEVPNKTVEMVNMLSLAKTDKFADLSDKLLVAVGLDIEGAPLFMNLAEMPHLLVAGATGSGKSVCVNSLIISILLRAAPTEVRFLMIDPKQVELSNYNGIPHLLAPVVTDPSKAAATLKWAVLEMNKRYEEFAKIGARNLEAFNIKVEEMGKEYTEEVDKIFIPQKKPYIVVIIDELADLMMVASSDVETMIARLAQMARATGIHLVVATQRPSVDVITGLIKANIPSRISFAVSSQIDSRTILDVMGAEKLLGKGDMLYKPVGAMKPKRVQGVYISDKEINKIVSHAKLNGVPQYVDEVVNIKADDFEMDTSSKEEDGQDELFNEAKQLIQSTGVASTSFLQRKMKIGYNRAARIIDELEKRGIISTYEGDAKSRQVLKFD
ncbi:MAG: hypothetical protein A2X42_00130 [Candidatus Margulisbacteria bacterium GWF2_38_17]|nr:MAG: hypothetical protein A2X43_01705 [Candidatus Margulisbacteria bacterium GWD2_39_127]OGI05523.1 MAG: hypothetical protein A2X42_00130 [Candidatus Margulisbacteria bacterium GWF2_38_17]OGI08327.1 MAG: hypothetical protein A2X41_00115 [Candidatus Margulisbacteria bacterium GWE2_39_32]